MKRTFVFCLIILLLLSLAAGCGSGGNKPAGGPSAGSEKTESTTPQEPPGQPAGSQNTGGSGSGSGNNNNTDSGSKASGKTDSLLAYVDEWDRISDLHEKAINSYEGVIIELPLASLPLSFTPMYETLNIDNKDGLHEGTLLLSGYPAFLEQKGNSFRFGYDAIRDKDGFAPGMKAGDRLLQEGSLEGEKGCLKIETRTERAGNITEKVKGAYLLNPQGTFYAIYQEANAIDIKGNENKKNTAVFLVMSEKEYGFVIAKGQSGTAFPDIELKEGLTVEKAKGLFSQAGYTIESRGAIIDGEFTVTRE